MSTAGGTRVSAGRGADHPLQECLPGEISNRPIPEQNSLVSIIVPCYNGAAFLEEALKSALTQSYAQVEVVVVDDGSTDSSPEIAQRFPVCYIRQQNRGLAEARNAGIRASRGGYVVFLDADDRLRPNAIETGVRMLETHSDCAIAVGDHVFISTDGSYTGDSTKVPPVHSPYEALLKSNFIEMISSVFFRRSVFDELGDFDSTLPVAEDYELYLRIARVRTICCHPIVVAEYRRHEASLSFNSELMLVTTLRVLEGQAKYVGNNFDRRNAFREGLRSWRKQYGRQLASELARSFFSLGTNHLRRKLLVLARYYPQGLLMLSLMLLGIMPRRSRRQVRASTRGSNANRFREVVGALRDKASAPRPAEKLFR